MTGEENYNVDNRLIGGLFLWDNKKLPLEATVFSIGQLRSIGFSIKQFFYCDGYFLR